MTRCGKDDRNYFFAHQASPETGQKVCTMPFWAKKQVSSDAHWTMTLRGHPGRLVDPKVTESVLVVDCANATFVGEFTTVTCPLVSFT